jgi:hypothetical protein
MKLTLALLALLLLPGCSKSDNAEPVGASAPQRQETKAAHADLWAPPIAPPQANQSDIQHLAASLPKAADVPIPAYPGARASMHAGPQGVVLNRVGLLTTDAPEDVFNFYRERLEGWRHHSTDSLWVLWKSESEKPITASSYTVPAVEIRNALPAELSELPGAKTFFMVVY